MSTQMPDMSQLLTGGTIPQVPGGLAQGLGGPGDTPDMGMGGGGAASPDPLEAIQGVIEDFPLLLVALHDPGDVHDATKALGILTGIQKRLMGGNGPAAQGG